jgi:protein-S-isoprenylcysteine O-methyltransferase Ste14
MEFLPELKLGWLNGWLLLVILYGIFGILLLIFPREVVSRLYDRSGWTRQDIMRRVIGFPAALATIGLFIFLPLRVGAAEFWIGLIIYAAALTIFNVALINYRNTPLDQPVTKGVYRFSRNPQIVGLILAFLGTAVAVGSWLMVILATLMSFGAHTRILAEERACLMQYGESYRAYMSTVPRFFGLPRQSLKKME